MVACSDGAPEEAAVAAIVLSVPDNGISLRFRDRMVVTASPQAALGVPLHRDVRWASEPATLLAIEPLTSHGDSARLRPTGTGTGNVRVTAGDITKTFQVTVQDTVFSVTVAPGAITLIAGDTVSFSANVSGPPSADRRVHWEFGGSGVLQQLSPPGSDTLRVQVRVPGAVSVHAVAHADTTKASAATVTAQTGRLAFVQSPTSTPREVPIVPVVSVEVQDATGNRSLRAVNTITLAQGTSACAAATSGVTVNASHGLAHFPRTSLSARCGAASLAASASPPALPVLSQPFAVTARSCEAVVPVAVRDTTNAQFESVDCVVMRGNRQFFSHTYVLTIPASQGEAGFRVSTSSSAFAPRVESSLWQLDPTVFRVDSVNAPGMLDLSYWLPPGTHRFVVTTPAPASTGNYARLTTYVFHPDSTLAGVVGLGCLIMTAPGVSIRSSLTGGECQRPFASRPGESSGRHFLLYQKAGQAIQVTYRPIGTAEDNDAHLEVFDVTQTTNLTDPIGSDDNSGGGRNGTDAQLTIAGPATGRFILIRAARVGGGGSSSLTLTITG